MFLASHVALFWLAHSIIINHNQGIGINTHHVHHLTRRFLVLRFVHLILRRICTLSTTSPSWSMSSSVCANHKHKEINQRSRSRSNQTKRVDHAKEFSSHQPLLSRLPDEQLHAVPKAAAKNHSEPHITSPRKLAKTESAKKQPLSTVRNNSDHVIRTKAATAPRPRRRTPYRRSTCLEHISAVNCTADCFNAEPLIDAMTPPPAPLPPRLPTPDLSDVDEDAFWSCCRPSESSRCSNFGYGRSDKSDDDVKLWNDMGKRTPP